MTPWVHRQKRYGSSSGHWAKCSIINWGKESQCFYQNTRWWWPGSAPQQTILMGLCADSWNNSLDVLWTLNVLHALPHILNVLQTCSHARDHIDALHGHLGLKERKHTLTAFTYKMNVGLNISVLLDLVRQLSCCLQQQKTWHSPTLLCQLKITRINKKNPKQTVLSSIKWEHSLHNHSRLSDACTGTV